MMHDLRNYNSGKKVESIKGKKDFVRVILMSSSNTEMKESKFVGKDVMGKTLGPGSYNAEKKKTKIKHISNWSIQKPNRFSSSEKNIPGPGSYDCHTMKR